MIQIKTNSDLVSINPNISEIALYVSELKTIINTSFSDWFKRNICWLQVIPLKNKQQLKIKAQENIFY